MRALHARALNPVVSNTIDAGSGTGAGYPRVGAAAARNSPGNANSGLVPNNYLAAAYAAPRERIVADLTVMLRGLADKKLLEL